MTADVPRRATFDDLRVGQWVAWCKSDGVGPIIGAVVGGVGVDGVDVSDGAEFWSIHRSHVEAGEVTILRDAPAPPVTVRREDYDALVAAAQSPTLANANVAAAARALIDNADTGTDQ